VFNYRVHGGPWCWPSYLHVVLKVLWVLPAEPLVFLVGQVDGQVGGSNPWSNEPKLGSGPPVDVWNPFTDQASKGLLLKWRQSVVNDPPKSVQLAKLETHFNERMSTWATHNSC